jgi:hypothetical protein
MRIYLTLILLVFSIGNFAGNEGAHGGDSYAYEFSSLGPMILNLLKEERHKEYIKDNKINLVDLETAMNETLVYSDEGSFVQVNGHEVDAINYPNQKKIILNRTRWRQHFLEEKLKIVYHEYLGIAVKELDFYKISQKFEHPLNKLSKELLQKKSDFLRYHGRCVVSSPLYSSNDVCDFSSPGVIKAISCAKSEAIGHCVRESFADCKPIQTLTKAVQSQNLLGFTYCEVTAIAL